MDGKSKDRIVIVVFVTTVGIIGLVVGLGLQDSSIRNTKAGEQYEILSITAAQEKSMCIGITGTIISDEDEQVILILKSQNNRILVKNEKQSKIPANLIVSDSIVYTKNGELKIIN